MNELTETQKQFLIKKYGDAYLSAKEKMRMIEELGAEAYNTNGLKPEFQLNHNEQATLNMPEELFADLLEEQKRHM